MKIQNNRIDLKSSAGSVVLTPTSNDDIYVLSLITSAGDKIEANTTQDGNMSVKGKVCKENEHIQQGVYHTMHISLGEPFELNKSRWSREARQILMDSARETPSICFVVFYEKECVVSIVTSSGVKNVFKTEIKNKNYKSVVAALINIKPQVKMTAIASFSSAADEFSKMLIKEDKSFSNTISVLKLSTEYKNIPNSKVVGRILTDKQYSKMFSEVQYVSDLRDVEFLFLKVTLGQQDICVGFEEVREAFDYGAIKTIFITDALYRPRCIEDRKVIEDLVAQATTLRAKICIIPVTHESGEKLKAMGGIAGLLKFTFK